MILWYIFVIYIILHHKDCNCEVWKIIVYPSDTAIPHNSSGGLSVPYSCLPHMTPLWGSYHWDALTGLSTANYFTATVNTLIPLTHTHLIYVLLYSNYYNGISIFYIHMPENVYCFDSDIKFCKETLFLYFWYAFQHFDIYEDNCNEISVTQNEHDQFIFLLLLLFDLWPFYWHELFDISVW